MTDEKKRKETLILASKSGNFLDAVYKSYLAAPDGCGDLSREIAALHNEGYVDVVAEFERLGNKLGSGPDYFMTRHVFEDALPHINAPTKAVMRCVLQLHKAAGQDMAAGTIFSGYINYCEKDPARPIEAMKLIESEHAQFADLLPATIVAGSRVDNPLYLAEVLRLCQHQESVLRQRAVFALSRVQWPEGASVPDSSISALEKLAAIETDDEILASVIKSAFAFFQQDAATEARVTAVINTVLPKGDECTLHAASMLLGFDTQDVPLPLLDSLLSHMRRVKPTNHGTLNNIDLGIAHLLKGSDMEKGLQFLEELLLLHAGTLTINVFDSVAREILTNKALLGKVTTRWFQNGTRVLCKSVHDISGKFYDENLVIDVDAAELTTKDLTNIVFVARKAIGYFFIKPITAASILISLMRLAPDDEVLEHLGELLFDPLLLNYTGSVQEYVETQAQKETGKVRESLDQLLAAIAAYLETLREVPALATLHPSQAHREAYRRYMSESTAASMKEAQKQSVLLSLVSRSTLLYGRKSINYIHGGEGLPRRMEIPLTSHSVQMEIPRMESLDEHGLNYILRVFRAEHFRT